MSSYGPRFRSLASMHRAGIPWSRAVESAGSGDPQWGAAARAIDGGQAFGAALAGIVDPLDRALIQAGEKDGSLEHVLEEIAEDQEAASVRRREEFTALLYPLLVAHVAAFLMPLPDLMQGNIGGALFWLALVLVPPYAYLYWRRRSRAQDRAVPAAGDPPQPRSMLGPHANRVEEADARALGALGRLYEAGVPMSEALDLAIAAGWGGRAAVDLAEARRRVRRGRDLAGAWRLVPEETASRLRSAEEAGSIGDALHRAADELRFSVQTRRTRTAAILPVVATLVLGGIVAWRLFSFYGGYYGNLPGL